MKILNKELEEFKFDNSLYIDWNERNSEELINHIVNTHHAKTFESLSRKLTYLENKNIIEIIETKKIKIKNSELLENEIF